MKLAGQKILVTGATGFIGGRLVEELVGRQGCRVRALVHNFANAPRIARFPVEMVGGDVADEAAVTRAAQGCDVIVHAAMGTTGNAQARRRATVAGTEAVLKAARAAKVERVVHLSTISVYGMTPDGDLHEQDRRGRLPDAYSRDKAAAEKLALHYHRKKGLPVAILQPTIVYGPFAQSWTISPLAALRTEQVILPEGGAGLCNAVYVDDVVDAIVRAAHVPEAVGECFLVSAPEPVTWKEFYGAYEEMLGFQSTVSLAKADFARERRQQIRHDFVQDFASFFLHPKVDRRLKSSALLRVPYRMAKSVIPRRWRESWKEANKPGAGRQNGQPAPKPKRLPDKDRFNWFAARTRVRIDKAKAVLGYAPKFDLQEGMRRTRLWAEWAALLD
jgi:nucleoside-diphosphate-sugar epimerase